MGLGRMQQTASDDEDNPKGATVAGAEEQKKMCKCRSWCYVWILNSLCEHDRRD